MSQDIRLYGEAQVWDQALQTGQLNLVQAIRDFWPSGITSVLDVGCGDGKLTSRLDAPGSPRIVGIDSSAEALSRLPFDSVLGDAQALPFSKAAFDLVMSTDTLEHMPEAEEADAWNELFRVAAKVVMVAVPFREDLLDATACCSNCGHAYHVNWHQRSYDIADLQQRAPAGWKVRTTVLAGEAWSAMLPPETQLRRKALGEWSGWELAICPLCGSSGHVAAELQPLAPFLAQALAKQLYPALAKQRYCRSHSEILVIFERDSVPEVALATPRVIDATPQPASRVDFSQQPAIDLHPFCQVAQRVAGADDCWRLQFPLYETEPSLYVSRKPGSQGALHLVLEDSLGSLFDGCVLEDGETHRSHKLSRSPVAGYYGILASCANTEPFSVIQLGNAPTVLLATGVEKACGYLQLGSATKAVFVQVPRTLWFDPATLDQAIPPVVPNTAQVLAGLQVFFNDEHQGRNAIQHSECHAADLNALKVQIQNLVAERDAFMTAASDANKQAVQLQNVSAERDALQLRALEADSLLVQLQNLNAERNALYQRAIEADELAVHLQNLTAERDTLQQRAQELERLKVQLQNLSAERDALQQRAIEADRVSVHLQNRTAERDILQQRAQESERLKVQLQNLSAERDALQQRAVEADQLAVHLQNRTAERDILQQRAQESERLKVQLQNLSAERDALEQRVVEADQLAVHLQNRTAERDALIQRTTASDHLTVQLQTQNAECIALYQQAQTHIETLQRQDLQRSLEAKTQLQEVLGRLAGLEEHSQYLNEQLQTSHARLAQLDQHMENRVGTLVRKTLANIFNKR